MIRNTTDETNFRHKLLLTDRQVSKLCKPSEHNSCANINLSKTQFSIIMQLDGFLGRLLVYLMKFTSPLMKNVIKPLAKSVLTPLRLIASASATDVGIQKNTCFGNYNTDDFKGRNGRYCDNS